MTEPAIVVAPNASLAPYEIATTRDMAPRLLEQYRQVLFSSLITSCGLDALVFADDEVNGHVDTLHNVAESAGKTGTPEFKNARHREAHEGRGDYDKSSRIPYNQHPDFIGAGERWKRSAGQGDLHDGYTDAVLAPGTFDRDHVVPVKEVHNDPRFALSGLDRATVASHPSNLVPTNESINSSKGDKTVDQFIYYIEDSARKDRWRAELDRADASPKEKHKAAQLLAVDAERLRQADNHARQEQARQHATAYYRSKEFLGTTSSMALGSGLRMAGKQAFGLMLMELFVIVHEQVPGLLRQWREAPDWSTRLDPRPFLSALGDAVRKAWERIRERAGAIFSAAANGFVAGCLAEVVTTIINIFTGTARSIMRLLRNFWSGLISSLDILLFNRDKLGPEAQLAAVMRVLSVAVGGMIQPIVAEAVDKLMVAHGPVLPGFVREVLSQFAGAALGGIVSVSLVYAIDHSPVVGLLIAAARRADAFTDAVYQQVAHLTGLTWQALKAMRAGLDAAARSPAVNVAALLVSPPIGLALIAYRAKAEVAEASARQQQSLDRIEQGVADLDATLRSGLHTMETLVRETNALLGCVVAGQDRQAALLVEIQAEIRDGFDRTRRTVLDAMMEGADRVALRDLQVTLNELTARYRNCATVLARGELPLQRDLALIEELSSKLIAQYETSFDAQPAGAPARLPLMTGMVFALGAWRDVRGLAGEATAMCVAEAERLADLARNELQALSAGASLWHLAERDSWLIEQYVVLCRSLRLLRQGGRTAVTLPDQLFPTPPAFDVVGWDDGLDLARDLLRQADDSGVERRVALRTLQQHQGWRTLAGLPRGTVVNDVPLDAIRERLGIPADLPLGGVAGELVAIAPELLSSNRRALARELEEMAA